MKFSIIVLILIALAAPAFAHEAGEDGEGDIVELPDGFPVPSIDLVVHKDPKSGYLLQLKTTNFSFDGGNISGRNVMGHGHADVLIDGVEHIVIGEWYHVNIGPGRHVVKATLSANNHAHYTVNNEDIEDTEIVDVPYSDLTANPDDLQNTPSSQYIYVIIFFVGIIIGYFLTRK